MRILYIVTVMGHGRGGHIHSLNHISKEIGKKQSVGIVVVGSGKSPVLESSPYLLDTIFFKGYNLFFLKNRFNKVIANFKPDIIHFFDVNSYNIIKLIISNKYKTIVNLCGGPNPIRYPKVRNLVLFSKENNIWFNNQPKFYDTNIYLIPNRASKIKILPNRKIKKDSSFFNFVRIARIGVAYEKSLIKSIDLVAELVIKYKLRVKLYIIGTIESKLVLDVLKKRALGKEYIQFVNDDELTKEASNMLYLADAVIATGRGIMEASSLGIPMLTPAMNSELPILVTPQNFMNFFTTNFSERNKSDMKTDEDNIKLIIKMIEDKEFYKEQSSLALGFFKKYFDVSFAYNKYIEAYIKLINDNTEDVSFFKDFHLKLISLYKFARSQS